MNFNETLLHQFKEKRIRVTKPRMKIAEVLNNHYCTIKDIHQKLSEVGYTNLATVYNNLEFLREQGIVEEMLMKGEKYYTYKESSKSPQNASSVFVSCSANNEIIEITNPHIVEQISEESIFRKFNINKVKLLIQGECNETTKEECERSGTCFLRELNHSFGH